MVESIILLYRSVGEGGKKILDFEDYSLLPKFYIFYILYKFFL
jgi:hypothetical protein